MAMQLNYDPKDVKTTDVSIASLSGSGVAFGHLIKNGTVTEEAVAVAPRLARFNNLRIGDVVEVAYVENFPDHVARVPWRAVAVYTRGDQVFETPAQAPMTKAPEQVRPVSIETRIKELVLGGEVWNRAEVYKELYGKTYTSSSASDVERGRYGLIGNTRMRLHDDGTLACAKAYAPGKRNASALYYAKSTHVLGRALMGLDVTEEDGE